MRPVLDQFNQLEQKLPQIWSRIQLQHQQISQIVSNALQGLRMTESTYTQTYHEQLKQQIINQIGQSEQLLASIQTQLDVENGFSVQANNAKKQQNNALQQQLDKTKQALSELKNAVYNTAGQSAQTIANSVIAAQQKLSQEANKLYNMASEASGPVKEQVLSFYRSLDPFTQWIPWMSFSTQVQNCILNACAKPSESDKNAKLLECTKNTLAKLSNLRSTSIDPLRTDLNKLNDAILRNKQLLEIALQNGVSTKGLDSALFGTVAEGMAAVRLGQVTSADPLLRTGFNVRKNNKDITDIDMITGARFLPDQPTDSRVTAMYELKTGEDKGDYKKNALQKFQFAKAHNAGKFIYWVNVEPGTPSFTSLMKTLTADAKTAKYTNFNPNRDVQYIKDVLPELRGCGY